MYQPMTLFLTAGILNRSISSGSNRNPYRKNNMLYGENAVEMFCHSMPLLNVSLCRRKEENNLEHPHPQ